MIDRKSTDFITPRGVAIYPRLQTPDTKYRPEGEYRVKLRLDPETFPPDLLKKLAAACDALVEETKENLVREKKGAKAKTIDVVPVLTPETDRETGEETGFVTINAKMRASGVRKKDNSPWSRKPRVFDSKGVEIKVLPNIAGGSELKLSVQALPYYTPKDNLVGMAYYLEAVQLLKLVESSGRSAEGYGFGQEDGYETVAEDAPPATTSDRATGGDEF